MLTIIFIVLLMTTDGTIVHNVCVQDDPILMVYGGSLSSCEWSCRHLPVCHYGSYENRIRKCGLYTHVTGVSECTGTILFSNSYASVSVNIASGTNLQYCSDIVDGDNMNVLGNMNSVGAKKKLECLPHHEVDGIHFTSCFQNESWSDYGKCVRVCDAPTDYSDYAYPEVRILTADGFDTFTSPDPSTMQALHYFDGSEISLNCADSASVLVGGPDIITCLSDGSWSTHGICVKACERPETIQNLVYSSLVSSDGDTIIENPSNSEIESFTYASGAFVIVDCSAGTLVGSPTVICQSGYWENFPVCQLTTMRMPCQTSSDCIDTNSQCRNGKCWCNPGLSYSPSESSCVDACTTYGQTFQDVPNYAIYFYDGQTATKSSPVSCLAWCEADSSCVSVEYEYPLSLCYYNTILPYQNWGQFKQDSDFYYYQRDCA